DGDRARERGCIEDDGHGRLSCSTRGPDARDEKHTTGYCGQIRSAICITLEVMLPTSARLLRVLTLLQARRFWTGAQLAERLEITERTVRRDVDRLRRLGNPITAAGGGGGGYQLGAGAALPPLLLDDDEALAVSLGLQSAAKGTVRGMEEAALSAL